MMFLSFIGIVVGVTMGGRSRLNVEDRLMWREAMPGTDFKYDVFISYGHQDEEWADKV
jgi:hypothetical protein